MGNADPVDMPIELEPELAPDMAPVPLMAAPRRLSLAAPLDGGKEDDPEASPVAQAPTGPRTTELVAQVSVPKMDVPQPPASGSSGTTRTVVVPAEEEPLK